MQIGFVGSLFPILPSSFLHWASKTETEDFESASHHIVTSLIFSPNPFPSFFPSKYFLQFVAFHYFLHNISGESNPIQICSKQLSCFKCRLSLNQGKIMHWKQEISFSKKKIEENKGFSFHAYFCLNLWMIRTLTHSRKYLLLFKKEKKCRFVDTILLVNVENVDFFQERLWKGKAMKWFR